MYKEINITLVKNHPENLRKDYDNLEELKGSILSQGIRQPLLVVPQRDEDGSETGFYFAVAGNRRLKAAELAGLEKVPCIIDTEMSEKQQIEVMLVENMQRSNLTPVEEAQGIQLMFDFGYTADEISQKTGLSKTTIHHRKKIAELDTKNITGQASIKEFIQLEQIKSLETKNKLLKYIGTEEFESELLEALDDQEDEEIRQAFREKFEDWAEEVEEIDYQTDRFVRSYSSPEDVERLDGEGYKVQINDYGYVYLYQSKDCYVEPEKTEEEKELEAAAEEKRAIEREWQKKKDELVISSYRSRKIAFKTFNFMGTDQDLDKVMIQAFIWYSYAYGGFIDENLKEWFGEDVTSENITEHIQSKRDKIGLIWALVDRKSLPIGWNKQFTNETRYSRLMEVVNKLGVKLDKEDIELLTGTHEIYEEES